MILDGFQCILKPGKFGYELQGVMDAELIPALEKQREELDSWCLSKVKNPKRAIRKHEPWEEVSEGKYHVKFRWKETDPVVVIVDSEGTPITDVNTPLYSGSKVKVAFKQKPYILKDGETYGTSLKLCAVQVIEAGSSAGVDMGDGTNEEAAALFGKSAGYKASEPNIDIPESVLPGAQDPDDDF